MGNFQSVSGIAFGYGLAIGFGLGNLFPVLQILGACIEQYCLRTQNCGLPFIVIAAAIAALAVLFSAFLCFSRYSQRAKARKQVSKLTLGVMESGINDHEPLQLTKSGTCGLSSKYF